MNNLHIGVSILFILTTLLTIWQFYRAANRNRTVLIILFAWLILQGAIAITGFYTVTDTIPPRFVLLIGPALIFIIVLFLTKSGKQFLDSLDARTLTMLHI